MERHLKTQTMVKSPDPKMQGDRSETLRAEQAKLYKLLVSAQYQLKKERQNQSSGLQSAANKQAASPPSEVSSRERNGQVSSSRSEGI